MSEREPHWWHINGVPNNMTRLWLPQIGWFVLFFARAFVPTMNDHNPEFQLTANYFMSMAAKSSDLADETSGANLQMEGYADVLTQSVKDLWEPEASDSSPFHLLSWSPAWRPLSSCPNTKYCLEIHATLMEELGPVPHPLTLGWPPLWKMCCAMLELDSPKQWWQAQVGQFFSIGDVQWGRGLTTDEARDTTFLLTGAGMWVGKLAYLAAYPMTIQEGKRAIVQAVTDHQVKARGPGCPQVNLPAQQDFQFNPPRSSPPKDASGDCSSDYPLSPVWPYRGWEYNRHWRGPKASITLVPFTFPRLWFWEWQEFIIDNFLDVIQVWPVRWIKTFQTR